jgi:hypothetical protein
VGTPILVPPSKKVSRLAKQIYRFISSLSLASTLNLPCNFIVAARARPANQAYDAKNNAKKRIIRKKYDDPRAIVDNMNTAKPVP